MKSFKVGDRVRIVCVFSDNYGKEATVTNVCGPTRWDNGQSSSHAYDVCIDGVGCVSNSTGRQFAFKKEWLEPNAVIPCDPPTVSHLINLVRQLSADCAALRAQVTKLKREAA